MSEMTDMILNTADLIDDSLKDDGNYTVCAIGVLKSLTPFDLAALAEPMGLALVPVNPTEEINQAMINARAEFCGAIYDVQVHQIYKAAIEIGRERER